MEMRRILAVFVAANKKLEVDEEKKRIEAVFAAGTDPFPVKYRNDPALRGLKRRWGWAA